MARIKYRIMFEGELNVKDKMEDADIREEIAREFYENDYDAFDAAHLSWEEIE